MTVDPALCPLCSQPNRCAMEVQRETGREQPPCWCTQVNFSADLLARLAPEQQGRACICANCASAGDRPRATLAPGGTR